MSDKFKDGSSKLKKLNTFFANMTLMQKAGLIVGYMMLSNAALSLMGFGPPLSLQTSFNLSVKNHKPVWTTAMAAYKGNDFCASNAASFATTQVLQSHTLEEIKSMAMEDFFAKAAPIVIQELHRIPGCENTTVETLVYQTGEISAAPALESPSIGLD